MALDFRQKVILSGAQNGGVEASGSPSLALERDVVRGRVLRGPLAVLERSRDRRWGTPEARSGTRTDA
jgi:hypothetical protein